MLIRLGDNELSALLLLESHCSFERVDRDGSLIVVRRLRGDLLEPEPWRSQQSQNAAPPASRKTDQFVAKAREQRKQHDARRELGGKTIEWEQSVDGHRNH